MARRSPTAVAVGGGVVAGVVLSLVGQLLMSALVTLDEEVGYGLGPAWWLILLAAALLAGLVALVVRALPSPEAVQLRRDARSAGGAVLVLLCAVGWVLSPPVSDDFGWWLHLRVAGLLLAAACLAVAVLEPGPALRTSALAAVATTGTWLVACALEGLALQASGSRPEALVLMTVVTLVGLTGAFVGGFRRRVHQA
jgi:hypothetical protein